MCNRRQTWAANSELVCHSSGLAEQQAGDRAQPPQPERAEPAWRGRARFARGNRARASLFATQMLTMYQYIANPAAQARRARARASRSVWCISGTSAAYQPADATARAEVTAAAVNTDVCCETPPIMFGATIVATPVQTLHRAK
jgi:hypothetical protein